MVHVVEGWTERIRCQLVADGSAQNLTGMTVALQAYSRTGTALTLTGTAGIVTAADGEVYFDPAAADLKATNSPMLVRWKVTDGSGKIAYFPSKGPDQWVVRLP